MQRQLFIILVVCLGLLILPAKLSHGQTNDERSQQPDHAAQDRSASSKKKDKSKQGDGKNNLGDKVKDKPKPKDRNKAKPNAGYHASVPMPTRVDVRYGKHHRNRLDFWKAKSDNPTPLIFVIHGGGWNGGSSQEKIHRFFDTTRALESGISVVSIHYRLMRHSQDVAPPVKAPLQDSARALQFVRSKSKEWNIDPQRIGGSGGSAGACTSLWLAYHDDMADAKSPDPIARHSTRLFCVAVDRPQTTLDPQQMKSWILNSKYGGHAFGIKGFEKFLAERQRIMPWIKEYSPFHLLTADDPQTYMQFSRAPSKNRIEKDPTHSAYFGIGLEVRCKELKIPCEVVHPGISAPQHANLTDYLIESLLNQDVPARKNAATKKTSQSREKAPDKNQGSDK